MRAHLLPALAVLRRDFLIATSYRVRFVTGLLSGLVNLAIFYYVSRLVRLEGSFTPDGYFAFVTVGIMIFTVVTATLTTPVAMVRQELVAGTFERMLLAPGGPIASLVSLLIFPALYALLTVVAMLLFAAVIFGVPLHWSTVPLSIPLAVLAIFAFAPFGIALQASVVVGKKAPPGAGYLMVGISLIAGLYFPVSLLPDWIEWTSQIQPFTPAADLLRWALAGQELADPAWLDLTKLAVFALVALPASMALLAGGLHLSRRRGTILEY